jgi:hypothetical protein
MREVIISSPAQRGRGTMRSMVEGARRELASKPRTDKRLFSMSPLRPLRGHLPRCAGEEKRP